MLLNGNENAHRDQRLFANGIICFQEHQKSLLSPKQISFVYVTPFFFCEIPNFSGGGRDLCVMLPWT